MITAYSVRFLCLCLACFFLAHLALALLIRAAAPTALRSAARMRPSVAARLLLLLRLAPAFLSGVVVAGFCAPSYLWLEPSAATEEQIGLLCMALSILGASLWAVSIVRGLGGLVRSVHYLQRWEAAGHKTDFAGESLPAWEVKEPAGLFAIGGIFRPRLFISCAVKNALSEDQIAVALRHERAHWISRDNLKRLLILLAPDILPFFRGFDALERGWARFTERAADDHAAGGDAGRSLELASALVRVSRLVTASGPVSLMAPLLAGDDDLEERVQRLLSNAPASETASSIIVFSSLAGTLASALLLIAVMHQAPMLVTVHRFLEYLIQ